MIGTVGGNLELIKLTKVFGNVTAVDHISLSIRSGEFVTLLGPSGSGKSTTLMMIAGFVEPDSGAIELSGNDLVGMPTSRRSLGVVFQSYALFPHMTVEENIAFPLRMRDWKTERIEQSVNRILELVHLRDLRQQRPAQLSGGQQQRVALARALVFEPPVLLLDEPLGALDRLLREEMKLELRRVHRELGTTMIYVTHDQDEALVLSDRIAVMRDGKIIQIGTPEDVYNRPENTFVAQFVGESNFIQGQIISHKGSTATIAVDAIRLIGSAKENFQIGDKAMLFVRPEKIILKAVTSDIEVQGVIEDRIYGGEAVRYYIRLGTQYLVAKQASRHDSFEPELGEHVAITWAPEDAMIFPSNE